MSNPTILPTRSQNEPDTETLLQKMRHLTDGIRRAQNSGTSCLDTGHLDDHVLKDIGLERSDLTMCRKAV